MHTHTHTHTHTPHTHTHTHTRTHHTGKSRVMVFSSHVPQKSKVNTNDVMETEQVMMS